MRLCLKNFLPMAAVAVLPLALSTGCANTGSPLPPSLMLPQPASDLSADRSGASVMLHWTTTRRATDKVLLKGDQRAELCRAVEAGPCTPVGTILVSPGVAATFEDTLPPELVTGKPRLVHYEVLLLNHRGQSAGASNLAYTAAGAAPPRILRAEAAVERDGIRVRWSTASAEPVAGARLLVHIVRKQILPAGTVFKPTQAETHAGVPQAQEQTLEAPEQAAGASWSPDNTLDTQVALERRYQYTVQLVQILTLDSQTVAVKGESADSPVLDARNTFPPDPPADLAAVAADDRKAIDLSWTPSMTPASSPGIAGYVVYRHIEGDGVAPTRVSGKTPVTSPSWSDSDVKPGVRYAYSVSAVDASGRESDRSAEVIEQLHGTAARTDSRAAVTPECVAKPVAGI